MFLYKQILHLENYYFIHDIIIDKLEYSYITTLKLYQLRNLFLELHFFVFIYLYELLVTTNFKLISFYL